MSNNIPDWLVYEPVRNCKKMACACQLKNKSGLTREQCENDKGWGNFVRLDWGCWIIGNGSRPIRKWPKDCDCYNEEDYD